MFFNFGKGQFSKVKIQISYPMEKIIRILAGEALLSVYGDELSKLNAVEEPSVEDLLSEEFISFVEEVVEDALSAGNEAA